MATSLKVIDIFKSVLNESASSSDIENAIAKRNYVIITYDDGSGSFTGKRLIQPYAYGLSKANNEVLRAFQVSGESLRGRQWKTFRVDRITSWMASHKTFDVPPPMQGYQTNEYNKNGDGSMAMVYTQVRFDYEDPLDAVKAQTKHALNTPKISTKNAIGPIPFANQQWKKNVFTSQPNSKKYQQYAKNIKDTENDFNRFDDSIWQNAEAEKNKQDANDIQSSVEIPDQSYQGPIVPDNKEKEKK